MPLTEDGALPGSRQLVMGNVGFERLEELKQEMVSLKRTVVACLITPGKGGQPRREVRGFGTMTQGSLELSTFQEIVLKKY